MVLPPFGTLIRQSAESLLSAWGVPPLSGFVEVLSVSTGRALTLENDAVWFVPLSAVEYELAHGMLVRLPLAVRGHRRTGGADPAVGHAAVAGGTGVYRCRARGCAAAHGGCCWQACGQTCIETQPWRHAKI